MALVQVDERELSDLRELAGATMRFEMANEGDGGPGSEWHRQLMMAEARLCRLAREYAGKQGMYRTPNAGPITKE